jgi:hypothetical protein
LLNSEARRLSRHYRGDGDSATTAKAERKTMNSLQLGEGGGLAVENDFRSATCGTSHFDGSPGWDEVTNIEDLQDCFFCSESFRKSRGSCGAVTAILQFVIREKTSAITIPKNL